MKNYPSGWLIKQDEAGYYIKLCKGCRTYEEGMEELTEDERGKVVYLCDVSVPFIPGDEKPIKTCPCSTCLVKMVCLTKCELLEEHVSHKVIKVGDEKT